MVKQEIAVVEEKSTAVAAPSFLVETSATDMVIPFLKVIQSQADEVTRSKDKYNEKVKAGDIYDATTRTVYNNAEIIICGIRKYYGEWEGDVRGTLVAKHKTDSDAIKNAVKRQKVSAKGTPYYELETSSGNKLIETFGVVCIVKLGDIKIPASFTLSKTAFTVGKTLNTMLTMYQLSGVPKFKFSTNLKQNDKGSWFVPVFDFAGYEEDEETIKLAKNISAIVDNVLFAFSAGEIDTATNSEEVSNEDVV